jgi:hypothetical protein
MCSSCCARPTRPPRSPNSWSSHPSPCEPTSPHSSANSAYGTAACSQVLQPHPTQIARPRADLLLDRGPSGAIARSSRTASLPAHRSGGCRLQRTGHRPTPEVETPRRAAAGEPATTAPIQTGQGTALSRRPCDGQPAGAPSPVDALRPDCGRSASLSGTQLGVVRRANELHSKRVPLAPTMRCVVLPSLHPGGRGRTPQGNWSRLAALGHRLARERHA